MFKSYRIGTAFGFPIEINVSFLILLAFSLLWGLDGLVVLPVAFGSVLLHELGHALMARHLGVGVAGIELHFFGGAAKMTQQPKSAGDEIAIAAAGPAVSFALGGVGFMLASLTGAWLFQLFAWANTIIGIFNLVPALPMDGGRIFRALLTRRMPFLAATRTAVTVARVFAGALAVYGLVSLQLYLVLLAGVLWLMGMAELRMAHIQGYGERAAASRWEVVPPGFAPAAPGAPHVRFHRPVATGGFTIRAVGGRFVIEPVQR
jgi:Zn-dependent protease